MTQFKEGNSLQIRLSVEATSREDCLDKIITAINKHLGNVNISKSDEKGFFDVVAEIFINDTYDLIDFMKEYESDFSVVSFFDGEDYIDLPEIGEPTE